ncbi:histone H1B-like [Metopolophium dirhodum]|uniref:histone H1B-like n=1 Tax=Metopolophium dirhodum TaxID=44670 RepID=UPI00298F616F|nr:histone H1B-like [Metopolophium dirhodum]
MCEHFYIRGKYDSFLENPQSCATVVECSRRRPTPTLSQPPPSSANKELKEKKGSSLPAIKKYLVANYKVDPANLAPFIRKFLKVAATNGTVVQTKGNGASGHFKLPVAGVKPKKAIVAKKKKSIVKKFKAPGTSKKAVVVAFTKPKAATKTKKSPAKQKNNLKLSNHGWFPK